MPPRKVNRDASLCASTVLVPSNLSKLVEGRIRGDSVCRTGHCAHDCGPGDDHRTHLPAAVGGRRIAGCRPGSSRAEPVVCDHRFRRLSESMGTDQRDLWFTVHRHDQRDLPGRHRWSRRDRRQQPGEVHRVSTVSDDRFSGNYGLSAFYCDSRRLAASAVGGLPRLWSDSDGSTAVSPARDSNGTRSTNTAATVKSQLHWKVNFRDSVHL